MGALACAALAAAAALGQTCRDEQACLAHHEAGLLKMQSGRYDEAAANLNKAILLHPNDIGPATDLAVVLIAAGQDVAAIEALKRVLDLDPKEYRAYISLGQLLKRKKPKYSGTEEAREAFVTAINIAPNDHTTHTNFGDLLNDSRNSSAIDAYFVAMALAPGALEVYNNMGHAWDSLTPFKSKEAEYHRRIPAVDKARWCFSKHQQIRMQQINAQRGPGRCKLRMVSEWEGEPGVSITELEREKVGQWYGSKHPLVVDMKHLEGFRLSHSKWHQVSGP
jgi:Flp pilus assembly protein TadD